MDRWIDVASVINAGVIPDCCGEMEAEPEDKTFWPSGSVTTLTYGHELWVVTERTRLPIQVAKMSFLLRVAAGLSLRAEKLWHLKETQSRAAVPSRWKEQAKVDWLKFSRHIQLEGDLGVDLELA